MLMIFQNALLHNISELVYDSKYQDYQMKRIPHPLKEQINDRAQRASDYCCGCEIRFMMLSDQVTIRLRRAPVPERVLHTGVLEVFQGDFQGSYEISPPVITTDHTDITITRLNRANAALISEKAGWTFHPELTRVLLPYDWGCAIQSITGNICPPKQEDMPSKTLLTYGSSITHGGNSATPSGTYAMQLARRLHMDLLNMGFAGSAYMDPALADYLADKPGWDAALIELGVNVVELWTVEQFRSAASAFLHTMASRNPGRTIFCTDIYKNHLDFKPDSHTAAFRDCLKSVVRELNLPNIRYVDGYSLLTEVHGLSSDGLHPGNQGHQQIAENLYKIMVPVLV